MEVFIGSPDYTQHGELGHFRKKIKDLVCLTWNRLFPDATMHYLVCTPPERWKYADRLCSEPVYILADDDCMPPAELNCEYVINLFGEHPDFGILAIGNPNACMGYKDEHISEVNSAGGIRFVRKGMVDDWPEKFTGDDSQHAGMIALKGFRSAYLKKYSLQHLGEGYSIWQRIRDGKSA